jgi:hypothetical protein
MAAQVTDDMLDVFAVSASWSGIADALLERYSGLVDRVFPYFALGGPTGERGDMERWASVAAAMRARSAAPSVAPTVPR